MFIAASAVAARTNTHLRILLASLHLRGHQTDLINAGTMSNVDRLGHPLIFQRGVAFDKDDAFGTGLEDLFETLAHLGLVGIFAIDRVLVIGVDDDDHRALVALI